MKLLIPFLIGMFVAETLFAQLIPVRDTTARVTSSIHAQSFSADEHKSILNDLVAVSQIIAAIFTIFTLPAVAYQLYHLKKANITANKQLSLVASANETSLKQLSLVAKSNK